MNEEDKRIFKIIAVIVFGTFLFIIPAGMIVESHRHERKLELERARAEHVIMIIREWRK